METAKSIDVYGLVTNHVIELLENGIIPWQQSWTEAGLPKNLITFKAYTGINALVLASMGYSRNYFLSFKQIKELGGSVKKGEKSIPLVFWKWSEKDGKKTSSIHYYMVFNVDQCKDLAENIIPKIPRIKKMKNLEDIISEMPNAPRIEEFEDEVYYHPEEDFINMPKMDSFPSVECYYGTLFRVLVHCTGHESRLNRPEIATEDIENDYSTERLIAEIGTWYLKNHTGIGIGTIENDQDYIQNWITILKKDKRLIVFASSKAQRAVDYILNLTTDVLTKPKQKTSA